MKSMAVRNSVRHPARRGLTLVEMLFSIAILLAGMVGIAAVLGTAGRNAVRSRALAESQSLSNNALDLLLAYQMNSKGSWNPAVIQSDVAVCIDPFGIIERPSATFFGDSANNIRRVSLVAPNGSQISGKVAEKLFMGSDDPVVFKSGDSTLAATRAFEQHGSVMTKPSIQGLYSWFVTIPLRGNTGEGVLASIVTVKNREFAEPEISLNVTPVNPGENGSAIRVEIDGLPNEEEQLLRSGDWLMLSARAGAVGSPEFDSWYRVVSVTSDRQPGASGVVLKATLYGRQLPATVASPVKGTFVRGVVNVHERVVTLLP